MVVERRFSLGLVREVLRLKLELKKSNRQIALALGISRSTVASYIERGDAAQLSSYDKVVALSDEELKAIVFAIRPYPGGEAPIDFEYVFKELKRKHVTLKLLWGELSQTHPHLFKYSRFCELYRGWCQAQSISLRQHHKAGEKLFIDYAGTTVPVRDLNSGRDQEAQIFLAVLGASNFSFIEATWTQTSKDFIQSNIRAFEFFGGVPEILVPDNLKAGVNEACRYEPQINRNYREMAKHYGAVVIPSRAYRPKDKAKVENGVLVASRWILAAMRNEVFFSLEDLNERLRALLAEFNQRKFQKKDGSRLSHFEEIEKKALKPLPPMRFVFADWKQVKVNIDYHVEIDHCHYSVPYRLRGKVLQARYTDTTVELFSGGERVAAHLKLTTKGGASTIKEHMPKCHQEYMGWSPLQFFSWAREIGPFTEKVMASIFEAKEHAELAYRSSLGIIRLAKAHGRERLELACERSLRIGGPSFKSIKSILEKRLESLPIDTSVGDSSPLDHNNIRGAEYYH